MGRVSGAQKLVAACESLSKWRMNGPRSASDCFAAGGSAQRRLQGFGGSRREPQAAHPAVTCQCSSAMSWFRKAPEAPPQLEDLADILAEGPDALPSSSAHCSEYRGTAAGGGGAPAPQALAGAAAAAAAAAAADDALPVSSSSSLPALSSPEKPKLQQDLDASSRAADGSGWLPSMAAWLPTRASSVAGGQQEQQEQRTAQQQDQQQPGAQPSWRDYLPSANLLPLPSLLGGSGGTSAAPAPALQTSDGPPTSAAAPTVQPAGDSSQDGSSLLGWAAAAPHQLASACHQAAHQLGTVGSTAVGASLLGATVGGIVAGPLGAAAGAKSGAAWVAAGALGGAAVQRLKDGIHPAEPAAQERELQAIMSSGSRSRSSAGVDGAGDGSQALAAPGADGHGAGK